MQLTWIAVFFLSELGTETPQRKVDLSSAYQLLLISYRDLQTLFLTIISHQQPLSVTSH